MNSTPPRVLVVTPEQAAVPRAGGEIRTQRLLAALSRHAAVHVVVLQDLDAGQLQRATGASRVSVAPRTSGPVRARLRALVHGWPLMSARNWHPEVARLVREEAKAGTLVVLEHVYLDVYRPSAGPYVLSTQNVESAVHRTLPPPAGLRRRVERAWDLWRLDALERAIATRSRARVVTVSERDASALRRPDALVVENGTDIPANLGSRPRNGHILFVGSMTWPPNVEAVRWWLDEVSPHLAPDLPPLTLVGRGGTGAFGGAKGLHILDEVAAMGDVLRQTRVVVVPLQHGGGTRLKVLEALAWGLPVVSTSKGVEGLRVVDKKHLSVVNEPAAFAEQVGVLYEDDAAAAPLIMSGRQLAETYDWRSIGLNYATALLAEHHG